MAAGIEPATDEGALPLAMPSTELDRQLDQLPMIELRDDVVPPALTPGVFFATMINRVLDNCPVNIDPRYDLAGAPTGRWAAPFNTRPINDKHI